MPIKPIDLQTLFIQLDKVGRERSAEKEGAAVQQSIQGAVSQKKAEEDAHSVRKAEESRDDADQKVAIKDEESAGGRKEEGPSGKKKKDGEDGGEGEQDAQVIRDRRLGGNVDILG